MINKVTVKSLSDLKPMNNNVIIQNITNSIEDSDRDQKLESKLIIVRNEANQKRERSSGKVVLTSEKLFIGGENSRCVIPVDSVLNKEVIYDTQSRLYEISVEDFPNGKFYLVRFPDIIAIIEKE